MRVVVRADRGQWIRATTAYEKIIAKAATGAVRDVAKQGVKNGRAVITAAGFSSKFANSLVARLPKGVSLDPTAYIHTTIDYADVFESGRSIAGQPLLWLPLPNVPPIGGRPHMTPSQYARFVGPLFTIRRPGKPPMLGSRRGGQQHVRLGRFRGRQQNAEQTVLLFVGVHTINIPRKFDADKAIRDAFDDLPNAYLRHLEKYEDR